MYAAASGWRAATSATRRTTFSTWVTAAPVNVIGSATSDSSWAAVSPSRSSAASRAKTSFPA